MVFNEASLPFSSIQDCEENIEDFFKILHEAKVHNIKFSKVDGDSEKWNNVNYATGFYFTKWLASIGDRDRQRRIKSVISNYKCPFSEGDSSNIMTDFIFSDVTEEVEVLGLGYASLKQSHGVSLSSEACWMTPSIDILKISEQAGQEIKEKIAVPNIFNLAQFKEFLTGHKAQKASNKKYLQVLKTDNNPIGFQNLQFTPSCLKSIQSSSLHPIDFRQVVSVLLKLNIAIATSNSLADLLSQSGLDISGESDSTMNSSALVRLRTFTHPTLGSLVYEDHVKNFIDNKRMHIYTDFSQNKICIGYYGAHLDT